MLMAEQCLEGEYGELQRYVVEGQTFTVFLGTSSCETLFVGSIDRAYVDPRVVLTRALSHQAASIVVAHNHPSGSLIPSAADIETTRKLARCLKLVDIALADHLIVASRRCESLRNLGFV